MPKRKKPFDTGAFCSGWENTGVRSGGDLITIMAVLGRHGVKSRLLHDGKGHWAVDWSFPDDMTEADQQRVFAELEALP